MKGSTWQEKNGTWTAQYTITRSGKRRTPKKRGFRVKSDATAWLNSRLAEEQRGARVEPSKLTVSQYLTDVWLPNVKRKPTTQRSYADICRNRIIPHLGDLKLTDLTSADVVALYARLRRSGRLNGKKGGLSEASIRRTHSVLHRSLEHAVEAQMLQSNPARNLPRDTRPRDESTEMKVWSADELRVFLASVAGDRLAPIFALAAMTGLRRGELVGLRWADVDLDRGMISVRRSRVSAGYQVTEGTTKSGRARTVALDTETGRVLRRHRAAQSQERLKAGELWNDTDLVVTREDGSAMHPESLSRMFDWRVKRAPVTRLTFHGLRHTSASLLLEAGVPAKVVSERLGHSNIGITLDVYSHVTPGMQDDAAAKLGALVFGPSA